MKKIDDYLKLNYRVEIVKDKTEGGYIISIPQLKGCITTSETVEEGMQLIEDAKKEWLRAALEEGVEISVPRNSKFLSMIGKIELDAQSVNDLREVSKL
jgi:predicted RNase H-like HicB family nuclease